MSEGLITRDQYPAGVVDFSRMTRLDAVTSSIVTVTRESEHIRSSKARKAAAARSAVVYT